MKADKEEEGMYTYKTHHPGHRLPWYVEMFIPKDKLVMHEETFNSHPCLLSTFTLPEFFGAKFCVTIKSKIVATKEESEEENIFCLAPEDLERRKMINVDIADDMFKPKDETREGPKTFKSMRRRRGPLGEGWQDSKVALSITHQLVTIDLPAPNFLPQKMISLGERMIGKFVWRYYIHCGFEQYM